MIIDASVALKWVIPEPDSAAADALVPRGDLRAPAILPIEVTYVLSKRVRRRDMDGRKAQQAWDEFNRAPLLIAERSTGIDKAFSVSLLLGASLYDCLYLVMAQDEGDVMVTADQRFARAVRAGPDRRLADHILTLHEVA